MAEIPAPAPAPTPAPAVDTPHEAVINPNPVGGSNPVGAQTVEKPEGDKPKAPARRDAIQKAFNKAKDAQGDDKPGIGHNKPPEALKADKRPTSVDQPQQGRERGEGGRFAPRQTDPGATPGKPGVQNTAQSRTPLPETAPYREPPPRMADHAKQEWAAAPESVRGEVYRMAQEAEGMHKAYRADYETMNSIRHFHKMATEHGTTLDRALSNYVSMEQKLRTDVVGGLDVIVNNLGMKTNDGQPITLRDVAYHVLSQSPEQLGQMQTRNAQQAAGHQIGALHQEIQGLKSTLQEMHHAQQFTYTRSAVDQFADQHPRFDELGDLIEAELKYGFDLPTAYQRASLLRPSTQAAQTRNPPAQTRQDKSIYGAPDSGSSNGSVARKPDKPVGRRDAIQDAIRRVNGGFA